MSPLAYLIAAEWNSVTTGSLKQHTLPLTSLACRAIDDLDPENPQNIREQVIEDLHLFIDTDAILFFAPQDQARGELIRLQLELWHPLIRWACNVFGELDTRRAEGGIGNFKRQAWKTRNVLKNWMMTYLPPRPRDSPCWKFLEQGF
jgi:ATP synthase mitochondrial F1 complex assembly factor 2